MDVEHIGAYETTIAEMTELAGKFIGCERPQYDTAIRAYLVIAETFANLDRSIESDIAKGFELILNCGLPGDHPCVERLGKSLETAAGIRKTLALSGACMDHRMVEIGVFAGVGFA